MNIQYLGVYNNSAQLYQDVSVLVRRTQTDKTDNIEICTPFEPWRSDYDYGIKLFWGLDDRGIALEEDQVIEVIDAWKKNWNQ